jgi:hypothetical protein
MLMRPGFAGPGILQGASGELNQHLTRDVCPNFTKNAIRRCLVGHTDEDDRAVRKRRSYVWSEHLALFHRACSFLWIAVPYQNTAPCSTTARAKSEPMFPKPITVT